MNNKKQNQKGFTMVELIIVIAIMAIIGAMLVPAFNGMSTRAKITTDLTTTKTLHRAIQSYKALEGEYPDGVTPPDDPENPESDVTVDLLIEQLREQGLLDTDQQVKWQMPEDKLVVTYDPANGSLKLSKGDKLDADETKAYDSMQEKNTDYMTGDASEGDGK